MGPYMAQYASKGGIPSKQHDGLHVHALDHLCSACAVHAS